MTGNPHLHENKWYNGDFDAYKVTEQPLHTKRHLSVICIGADAAGLDVAYKASRLLENVELRIYEKNIEIGGTWLENRYPRCACDIPSHSYQFTWARNPNWSQFYSSSEEIWQYMKDIAEQYDLLKYVKFDTAVEKANWNEQAGRWELTLLGANEQRENDSCDILINGSGVLNSWKYPDLPGLELFKGTLMHGANWDPSVTLDGRTVAVIGAGSSAIQIIPSIQPRVAKLIPFVRSPSWITPGFGGKYAGPGGTNFAYSEDEKKHFNQDPKAYDKYCREAENEFTKRFAMGVVESRRVLNISKAYVLKTSVVPKGVVRLTEDSVVDESGEHHPVDIVICATGFDTSFTPHFKVVGRQGTEIHDVFKDYPLAYLGVTVERFPNFSFMIGPNGPVAHGSVIPVLEWYTRYMFQCIEKIQTENIKAVEMKKEVVKELYNHTHELMKWLVYSSTCRSWYKNGKVHGPVTAIYPGSRLHFFKMLQNVRWEDYNITYLAINRFQFMGNGYTFNELDPDQKDKLFYLDILAKI